MKTNIPTILLILLLFLAPTAKAFEIIVGPNITTSIGTTAAASYTALMQPNETAELTIGTGTAGVFLLSDRTYFSNPQTTTQQITFNLYAMSNRDLANNVYETRQLLFNVAQNGTTTPQYIRMITLNLTKPIYPIFDSQLAQGQVLNIGAATSLTILALGTNSVQYSITGCDATANQTVASLTEQSYTCGSEKIRLNIGAIYALVNAPAQVALKVSASYNYPVTVSPSTATDTSCKLALNTISTARRGKVFGLETVGEITGTPISDVSIVISDVGDELGNAADDQRQVSDRTGYAQFRLSEDTVGPMIIRLSKEGCKAFNKQIEFDTPYTVYVANKQQALLATSLNVSLEQTSFYTNKAITGKVVTGLSQAVDTATVYITNPANKIDTITTDTQGAFSYTPTSSGMYYIQPKKDGFTIPDKFSISVTEMKRYGTTIYNKNNGMVISNSNPLKVGMPIEIKLDYKGTSLFIDTPASINGNAINFVQGVAEYTIPKGAKEIQITIPAQNEFQVYSSGSIIVKSSNTILIALMAVAAIGVVILLISMLKKGGNKDTGGAEYNFGQNDFGGGQ
jgi:hypothetical protein